MTAVQRRVNRGARLLDKVSPGWYQDVNTDYLNMSSRYDCVLGQIYYGFTYGVGRVGISWKLVGRYGFDVPWYIGRFGKYRAHKKYKAYEQLRLAWIEAINERKCTQGSTVTGQEAA